MLDAAIKQLKPDEHPVIHSDRGWHYRVDGWLERLHNAKMTQSMSKKGCSPDNAACEGFFGRIKNEMFYNKDWRNVSINEFMHQLDSYLVWYNSKRIKLSLDYRSIVEYRKSIGISV